MNEIEFRKSTLTEVDTKLRLIDLIAVPWEQETEIPWQGELWREVFSRGAFKGIEDHAGRVRVNREHVQGDTVGKVVHFDSQHEDGLLARVKIAQNPRGDDTLALAEEDMISASVGFRVKSHHDVLINKRAKVRRVLRAFLDHLSMVENPAYVGAKVLAVRAESSELTVVESPSLATPILDEMQSDELIMWARARLLIPRT